MPEYRVKHRTRYSYDAPVSLSYGQSCLLPRQFAGQTCRRAELTISPMPQDQLERLDFYGNRVSYFSLDQPHDELEILASSEVEVSGRGDVPTEAEATLEGASSFYVGVPEAVHYQLDSQRAPADDRARAFAEDCFSATGTIFDGLERLVHKIYGNFGFDAKATTVNSTLDDLFEHEAGVCQDFAHLAVAAMRAHGLPARYVSGYLETVPPPGKPKLVGADVSHAWASAMLPGGRWIDLDPTNDQFVDDRYVTTGWGRDYADVPPLKGVIYSDSRTTRLDVSVDVSRMD